MRFAFFCLPFFRNYFQRVFHHFEVKKDANFLAWQEQIGKHKA